MHALHRVGAPSRDFTTEQQQQQQQTTLRAASDDTADGEVMKTGQIRVSISWSAASQV
jgi:hypothetical protein